MKGKFHISKARLARHPKYSNYNVNIEYLLRTGNFCYDQMILLKCIRLLEGCFLYRISPSSVSSLVNIGCAELKEK